MDPLIDASPDASTTDQAAVVADLLDQLRRAAARETDLRRTARTAAAELLERDRVRHTDWEHLHNASTDRVRLQEELGAASALLQAAEARADELSYAAAGAQADLARAREQAAVDAQAMESQAAALAQARDAITDRDAQLAAIRASALGRLLLRARRLRARLAVLGR